ncbi:MAG: hypothetical protein Ct9H300mP8_09220 [Gammaproteobacteria bacterium]|nr:MAG: hypothetical protein Ct9H300mP8_09220 [Gammaproteobacteria bacterium]
MIKGGGLGIYTPKEVGPMSFQVPNGVVEFLQRTRKTRSTSQEIPLLFSGPDQRMGGT